MGNRGILMHWCVGGGVERKKSKRAHLLEACRREGCGGVVEDGRKRCCTSKCQAFRACCTRRTDDVLRV